MSLIPDERAFALTTLKTATPVVRRHLPDAGIEVDCFDVFLTIDHGADSPMDPAVPHRIAYDLRGGRHLDVDAPTDWHVRGIEPKLFLSDLGDHPREGEVIGTQVWLSRTFPIPSGYKEIFK